MVFNEDGTGRFGQPRRLHIGTKPAVWLCWPNLPVPGIVNGNRPPTIGMLRIRANGK